MMAQQSLLRRKWFAIVVMLMVCWTVYLAAKIGIADLVAIQSRRAISEWDQQKSRPPLRQWLTTRDQIKLARDLDPANPVFVEDLGRIYDRRLRDQSADSAATQAFAEQALIYFRQAVRQRPVSAYSWADVALIKLKLDRTDEEFLNALQQAIVWGPWEPDVQFIVAEAGLATWDKLSPQTRAAVSVTLERVAVRHAEYLTRIAKNHARMHILCSTLKQTSLLPASACDTIMTESTGHPGQKK